ncbi:MULTISPECIES: chromosome partition protein MukE [unclassified Vibrio]|uniref:chromosome partition protein MukE n=1 Tax=unclassified Vibrio TaxID=2614977 RepID=UPI0012A88E43|nr:MULTISPECIES: chromosome partition protein MukE [unclassified Vibrio]QFT37715.1 Chromosome partition protein MukE [Vibrio sp. THAF64]QGM35618.1 Chromosome partition protein MukE [Vibrio sp. THAF191d]QGN71118.1 Chromosome partition protein MukE [Vibrio sp. THAF191c]
MNEETKTYESILDVMADPLFSQVDTMLRAGINIVPEDDTLHSFVNAAYEPLKAYLSSVYITLRCSPEQVYYSHMQRRTGVPHRTMSELSMVVGLTMVSMQLDLRQSLESSDWVAVDHLIDRLIEKLPEERIKDLFGSRRSTTVSTQFDQVKIRDEVMKCIRDLNRKSFIRMDTATNQYMPTAAIYRFIDPLRGIVTADEIPNKLIELSRAGYLVSSTAQADTEDDLTIERPHWTSRVEDDSPDNLDLFDLDNNEDDTDE